MKAPDSSCTRSLTLATLAAVALSLVSCATPGTRSLSSEKILEEFPTRIQRGVTKKEAVRRFLGEPQKRQLKPSGERWLYGSAASLQDQTVAGVVGDQVISTGIGMIPYAGGAVNGLRSIARGSGSNKPGAWVDFDQRGIVRDYSLEVN